MLTLQFSGNATTGQVKEITHGGRRYLVSPVVALREGILNDTYVSAAEFGKFASSWQGRPVPIAHPKADGLPTSANTPDIWANDVLGHLWNVAVDGGALKGEIWITFEWTISEGIAPPIVPPATDVETGRVTAQAGLNVRRGPDTSYALLGTLAYGSTVLYDDNVDGWLHVVDGYVSAEYVGEPQGTVIAPIAPSGLVHPLPGSVITQRFGENPENYVQYGQIAHNGVDLAGVPAGSPILTMADGVVYRTDYDPGYGNYVMIAHDQRRLYSVYCHCSELLVLIGSTVSAGEQIALVGSTGNSTADHLHFEIREMNADGSYGEGQYGYTKGRDDPETVFHVLGGKL